MGGLASSFARQQGATLMLSLLFLIIVTLLGASAMRTSITVERMASNLNDQNLSFQAAESALVDFEENYIFLHLKDPYKISDALHGTSGLYGPNNAEPVDDTLFLEDNWTDLNSRAYRDQSDANPLPTIKEEARGKIKRLHPNELRDRGFFFALNIEKAGQPKPAVFRVTARSRGGSNRSQSIVRSHVMRVFE